jgi:hypothetical protein
VPKVNNQPKGENSPNLVTLLLGDVMRLASNYSATLSRLSCLLVNLKKLRFNKTRERERERERLEMTTGHLFSFEAAFKN